MGVALVIVLWKVLGGTSSGHDISHAHFFWGPHELKTAPLAERFGEDPQGFGRAAAAMGGKPVTGLADAAFQLPAFPRVPVTYLLWLGDEDFPAEVGVLFDRSIEHHLSADGIYGTVVLVSDAILGSDSQ